MIHEWFIHFKIFPIALIPGDQPSWCLHSSDGQQGPMKMKWREQDTWSGSWWLKERAADNKFTIRSCKALKANVKYLYFIPAFGKEISKTLPHVNVKNKR